MFSSTSERPRRRRVLQIMAAVFTAAVLAAGLSAVALESETTPAAATTISFSQCNAHAADALGAALTETCSISITNNISASGGTSSSTVITSVCSLGPCTTQTVNSSDVINAVHQCNGSNNEGGSTTVCNVNIINNIALDGAAPASALTVDQCNGSGGGGGTNMAACLPSAQGSPVVTQCDGSATGGGGFMICDASGTVSADFPMVIDQCNGSENGGGSTVTCHVTITTIVTDTAIPPTTAPPTTAPPTTTGPPTTTTPGGTPGTGTPGTGTPGTGTPGEGTPGTGTPGEGTPGTGTGTGTGTPGTGTPGTGTPGTPTGPPVEVPPPYTG